MSQAAPKASIYFRSLGCPKNQLDSEIMLGHLALDQYTIAERIEDADVAIVNTCSFIQSAREESIETILDLADLRENGALRALVVTGCLPQRYGWELAKELPEVDAFVGTGEFQKIAGILNETLAGKSRGVYVEAGRTHLYNEDDPRLLIGPQHSAYVKIAEGCNRVCAFCAIPSIRGAFQSRTLDSLVNEAQQLAAQGTKEINLIAQDSVSWGKDLPERQHLEDLLRALDDGNTPEWIRLLYLYPTAVSDELLSVLGNSQRVLPYIDIPLQHASDPILKQMKRGVTEDKQYRLLEKIRTLIPHATLRTTFIVGFPGETDSDFEKLCDFVQEMRFDRVGVFRYSDEEGTSAFDLPDKVTRGVARERHRQLMTLQHSIMNEKLKELVGTKATVLVDSVGESEGTRGRLSSQAPEIDGVTFIEGEATVGEFLEVEITSVRELDLEAKPVAPSVHRLPIL